MKCRRAAGLTFIELIIAMFAGTILTLVLGTLLLGSNNAYGYIYSSVNAPIRQDAIMITTLFGSIGRKSNRSHYTVYTIRNSSFIEATPENGQTVAVGQAVEFRYWDEPFYELFGQSDQTMDVSDTGTRYALFFLDGDTLYGDFGPVENGVGAIQNGRRVQTDQTETRQLVSDVDIGKGTELFSHEIVGGSGSGCVNLTMTLTNDEGESVDIKTATLLRVVWPN